MALVELAGRLPEDANLDAAYAAATGAFALAIDAARERRGADAARTAL
jgi:hypothetical protein